MAKTIEPKLCKIKEYLKLDSDAVFIVPEYQRAYSWGIDNCDKLWQDIYDFTFDRQKDSYFFGTIIINCQANDKEYHLIDGQQRTITFLLLLKALLVKINDSIINSTNSVDSETLDAALQSRRQEITSILYKKDKDEILRTPDDKDKETYENVDILKNLSINEDYANDLITILKAVDYNTAAQKVEQKKYKQKDNRYTNFFRNYKFFYEEKIKNLKNDGLNDIAKSILKDCEVIRILSWNFEQAVNMFNSLNSDGLPLYDSDIISAKLYEKAKTSGLPSALNKFKDLWGQLRNQIGELNRKGIVDMIADMDEILMQYMYYKRTIDKQMVNEKGAPILNTPGMRRYYTEDMKNSPARDPIKMCTDMLNLVRMWKIVSEYPYVQILLKCNANAKLFLASFLYRFNMEKELDDNDLKASIENAEEEIRTIVESLLRLFVLLELVDFGYSSKNFKSFLFKEAVKLADKGMTVDEIKKDFDEHIKNNQYWNQKDIKDEIRKCDKNILVYLNEYLFANEKNVNDFSFKEECDIEHIMPQSGRNIEAIRNDAGIKDNDEFRETVNKLGNKILLERRINRGIGNDWFRTKVSTKLENKTGYIDSEYPIAKALVEKYGKANKPFWTKDDIVDATEKASERIVRFIFGE